MRPAGGVSSKNVPQASRSAFAVIRHRRSGTTPEPTLILARISANPSERGDREARAAGAFFPASGRGAGAATRLRRGRAALTSGSHQASPSGHRGAADAAPRTLADLATQAGRGAGAMRPAGGVSSKNVPQASRSAFAVIRHRRSGTTPEPTLILARISANPSERGDREARAGGAFFPASGRGAGGPTRLRRRSAAPNSRPKPRAESRAAAYFLIPNRPVPRRAM